LDPRIRKVSGAILRILLSAGALYVVFRQLDMAQLRRAVAAMDPGWALLALGAYVLSKVMSASRLMSYLRSNDIVLADNQNLRLYFIGMFYNLFLPGGIGGDAYKVWLLHREQQVPVAKSVQAMLLDRINGLIALAALGFLFGWFAFPEIAFRPLLLLGFAATIPATYLLHQFLGKQFLPDTFRTTLISLGVQTIQVASAWFLLRSLHIFDDTLAYLTVFLVSSLVSVLPISVGGIGLRELVFVSAASYSPISRELSVAFSLVFFAVTALSSLPGGFLSFRK
jgi:uncharacterized membrane protein YbhN (UPF0104 family)